MTSSRITAKQNARQFPLAFTGSVCALLVVLGMAGSLQACAVPVFRYALERDSWHPAPYLVFLFHRGQLGPHERETLQVLEEAARRDSDLPANVLVEAVDLQAPLPEPLVPLWELVKQQPLPRLVVCAPTSRYPLWTGEATAQSAAALLDSPARRDILQRLAHGDAAVWVLLDSGQADKDSEAERAVRRATEAFARTFRFSSEAIEAMGQDSAAAARISFSYLRIRRDDPRESVFTNMLLSTEPDLRELSEPMVFTVFGRGRTLLALVGGGISSANVRASCAYITGDCSCEVKADNPGADLLFRADWYRILAGVAPGPYSPDQDAAAGADASPPPKGSSRTVAALLLTGGVLLLVVAVGSLLLRRGAPKGG